MKILLLEDDVALSKAIQKVTQLDKHQTDAFFDGQVVFDNLNEAYDLYILDINVPHINGLELLEHIQAKNKNSKVIIISSNTDLDSLQHAYAVGCVDYIKKPFHIEELRIKIERLDIPVPDLWSHIALKRAEEKLTKKEKLFLSLLLNNQDRVITYEMIEEDVYKDKTMQMNALRNLVRRLRMKLENDFIETVLQEGYRVPSKLM